MSAEVITAIVTGVLALAVGIINAQNSATKEELVDLRKRVDELKADLNAERDSNNRLREQITAAEDAVVAAASEKRSLKLELEEVRAELKSRDKQVKLQQDTINKQDSRIKELECKVNELEILLFGKQNGSGGTDKCQ
jgi:chromosome segregation ATPase